MPVQYLMTLQELYDNAAEMLGSMSDASYGQFMEKARAAAERHGIKRPKLAIDIKFKAGQSSSWGVTETPYPISEEEWPTFLADAREKCEHIPNVYLVDGDRFTLPI